MYTPSKGEGGWREKSVNCAPILKDMRVGKKIKQKLFTHCKGEFFWRDMNIKIVHSL